MPATTMPVNGMTHYLNQRKKLNMTKLTKFQKTELKGLKALFPNVHFVCYGNATVGIERTGDVMGRFAVAIAAADEPKFRRKVGELLVLRRFDIGQTLPCVLGEAEDFYSETDVLHYTGDGIAMAVS